MTQAELADLTGLEVATISRIERDVHRTPPYPSTIRKLAAALAVDARWLASGEAGPPRDRQQE